VRWFVARAKSFVFAGRGLLRLFEEPNAKVHAAATVVVVALGVFLEVNKTDWLWLCCAIAVVWIAEALNTALELACDAAVPARDPKIGAAKDVAAAAALLAALFSMVVGALVFGPYLLELMIDTKTGQ